MEYCLRSMYSVSSSPESCPVVARSYRGERDTFDVVRVDESMTGKEN